MHSTKLFYPLNFIFWPLISSLLINVTAFFLSKLPLIFACSAPSSSSSSSSPPLSPHAREASLSLFPSLCVSLSLHHLSSLLVLDRDDSPRQGCAHHPNNEVHFFFFYGDSFFSSLFSSLSLRTEGKASPFRRSAPSCWHCSLGCLWFRAEPHYHRVCLEQSGLR